MTLEYLTIAKLGGEVVIPNNSSVAEEMLKQLELHRIIYYNTYYTSKPSHKYADKPATKTVVISRIGFRIKLGERVYWMKKGDTIFLDINNE